MTARAPHPASPTADSAKRRPARSPKAPGVPTRQQVRPPSDGKCLPLPGASDHMPARRTAQHRVVITPQTSSGEVDGFLTTDPYVRRFWVAAIGPGAVADLLRLAAAAQRGRSLPMPVHLPVLLHERLVSWDAGVVLIPDRVPPLPRSHVDRLTPRLRRQLLASTTRRLTS